MKLSSIALACALLCGTGSEIARAHGEPARRAGETPQVAASAADAAIVAYGTWAQQMQEAQAPLTAAFTRLAERVRNGASDGMASLLATTAAESEQVRRLADEVAGRIAALALPDVSVLSLDNELTPTAIQREQLAIVGEMKRLVDQVGHALNAAAEGKIAESNRAVVGIVDSAQTMIRQRVLFLRAALAVTPREESSWDLTNAEIVTFRAVGRLMRVFMPGAPELDPAVARDLRGFADQLAKSRRAAETKLRSEAEEVESWLADVAGASPGEVRLARRAKEVGAVSVREAALLKEWEQYLREAATGFESPSVSRAALSGTLLSRMRELRRRGDAITAELMQAMAAR